MTLVSREDHPVRSKDESRRQGRWQKASVEDKTPDSRLSDALGRSRKALIGLHLPPIEAVAMPRSWRRSWQCNRHLPAVFCPPNTKFEPCTPCFSASCRRHRTAHAQLCCPTVESMNLWPTWRVATCCKSRHRRCRAPCDRLGRLPERSSTNGGDLRFIKLLCTSTARTVRLPYGLCVALQEYRTSRRLSDMLSQHQRRLGQEYQASDASSARSSIPGSDVFLMPSPLTFLSLVHSQDYCHSFGSNENAPDPLRPSDSPDLLPFCSHFLKSPLRSDCSSPAFSSSIIAAN